MENWEARTKFGLSDEEMELLVQSSKHAIADVSQEPYISVSTERP